MKKSIQFSRFGFEQFTRFMEMEAVTIEQVAELARAIMDKTAYNIDPSTECWTDIMRLSYENAMNDNAPDKRAITSKENGKKGGRPRIKD